MTFQGLILSLKELNIAGPKDPERFIMEDGLTELLDGIYRYGVQIINLDMFHADTPEKVGSVLSLHQLSPENCLFLAAASHVLSLAEALGIAAVGYVNPALPPQELSGAVITIEGFDEVDFYFLERMYQRFHGIPWTVIETERCILREQEIGDLEAMYRIYQGETVAKYIEPLNEDWKKEEEYTRAYIKNMYVFYGYGMWAAVEKATGKIIGKAGLNNRELHGKPSLELGYLIGEEYQGRGFATELCEGILQFAREGTEFEEIHCLIEKGNGSSVHLAEKLGFLWQEELKIQGRDMQRYTKPLQF